MKVFFRWGLAVSLALPTWTDKSVYAMIRREFFSRRPLFTSRAQSQLQLASVTQRAPGRSADELN